MNAQPLVEVRGLSKHFPIHGGLFRRVVAGLKAVDDVSFVIHAGRTLGLVGESGCGKSTLGRMLLRLQEPTAGQVLFAGEDLTRLDRHQMLAYRQRIQAVFQDPYGSLSPRRTVGQTVREPLDVHRVGTPGQRQQRVDELLAFVGLSAQAAHRYPHEFSGGQRQRIAIARAVLADPRVLILDDATSAVDPAKEHEIREAMAEVMQGRTTLVIAHRPGTIALADEVVLLDGGRVAARGPHDRLLATVPEYRRVLAALAVRDEVGDGDEPPVEGDTAVVHAGGPDAERDEGLA